MNVASARISDEGEVVRVQLDPKTPGFEFPRELLSKLNVPAVGGELSLGIGAEGVLVSREAKPGYLPLEAHIIEPIGSHDIVDLQVGHDMLRARTAAGFVPNVGELVYARIDPAQAHFFGTRSGRSPEVKL